MSAYICDPELFKALGLSATDRTECGIKVDPRYLRRGEVPRAILQLVEDGSIYLAAGRAALASWFADTLYQENIRSVRYRYETDKWEDLPGPCVKPIHIVITARDCFEWSQNVKPSTVQIFKAMDCLDYQSCETPDWEDSLAFEILSDLRKATWKSLPGYDDAEWGIAPAKPRPPAPPAPEPGRKNLTRKEETKAVKSALLAEGIKAEVKHGRGTGYGWLHINIGPGNWSLREKALRVAMQATGRHGDFDGRVLVLAQ